MWLYLKHISLLVFPDDYTADGFCDYEQTSFPAFGSYDWPESKVGNVTLPCVHGSWSSLGQARRVCNASRLWEEPDFTECIEGLLLRYIYFIQCIEGVLFKLWYIYYVQNWMHKRNYMVIYLIAHRILLRQCSYSGTIASRFVCVYANLSWQSKCFSHILVIVPFCLSSAIFIVSKTCFEGNVSLLCVYLMCILWHLLLLHINKKSNDYDRGISTILKCMTYSLKDING